MMRAQPTLFTADQAPRPPRPRQAPRKLMHFVDVGSADGESQIARFECGRCGHDSDWIPATDSEVRRGVPCPKCNEAAH